MDMYNEIVFLQRYTFNILMSQPKMFSQQYTCTSSVRFYIYIFLSIEKISDISPKYIVNGKKLRNIC